MISKELLSIVIDEPVFDVEFDDHNIYYRRDSMYSGQIKENKYEIAALCKKWAIKQNYIINSCVKHTYGQAQVQWYEKDHVDQHGMYREHYFESEWFKGDYNDEPAAIIKAAEWILEQING